ncbi:hypothetical protein B484DRAFT_447642 [Ochromonadaceae sp. CCMP2298]|nr:hypothetical protein B484DRAFT_447642 [Ochromonadaceae sp. CCMP2298]|eukprot:CAMPEP_0173184562 /NCGR_PEP_ID=MMETSP1141-20130122/9042_1 /TAXON_ID=483371 /ORGANISM="non described non described, Strain CCMP2298" /LENGTH=256 /DNA_ID=CAMNT_0014107941 /DNA_START=128 /DNA_END=898 /DNA_ORIENTATION=+
MTSASETKVDYLLQSQPADGNDNEEISPFQNAYAAPEPTAYMKVGEQSYSPCPPDIPAYCNTILDCAALFGNTSLACQYGWRFARSVEFWKSNEPLSEEAREKTQQGRRLKMIGLDVMPLALAYSKKMNIVDETISQDFGAEMSEATRAALVEADVMVMQQCLSHMPIENLKIWIAVFTSDKARNKRMIYDHNPYFDSRDMSPKSLCEGLKCSGRVKSADNFYKYRNKTDEEFKQSQENGRDMCVTHYVVDFQALA